MGKLRKRLDFIGDYKIYNYMCQADIGHGFKMIDDIDVYANDFDNSLMFAVNTYDERNVHASYNTLSRGLYKATGSLTKIVKSEQTRSAYYININVKNGFDIEHVNEKKN